MSNKLRESSWLMQALLSMGNEKLAWACRRLHCPVPKSALVLEVGSGGSPYFRANVLIDAHEETRERHWAPFITDRPSVLGRGEALPFRDKCFDFVIASHVLEHSADPQAFLTELQRVAKAGYIETPNAFMERINPYWDHRAEVRVRDGVLEVRKKPGWQMDPDVVDLYENGPKGLIAGRVIPENPFAFHNRFYWVDRIPFRILNPEVDSSWPAPQVEQTTALHVSLRAKLGRLGLAIARMLLSQKMRNSQIRLDELLQCPNCKSTDLTISNSEVKCCGCGMQYDAAAGVPRMSVDG